MRAVARELDVPKAIIAKAPSADLWAGQSDEEELGFTYDEVDLVLYLLFDRELEPPEVAEYGFEQSYITRVVERVRAMEFKRRLPLIARISAVPDGSTEGAAGDGGG